MTTGTVPQNMKVAKVIPIFKSGDKHKFNNYRPISILPAFSKNLEKVMSIKLTSHLEAQRLFYEHQYGFRTQHNTMHPIIHLTNQIAVENDKPTKDLTLSVFIDLSKAFDTISHKILLCKMEQLGIWGVANAWFNSYLTNREQYIELYNLKSSKKSISCGVPQGSILGPILVLIYVNDINNATSLSILSFADDTTITSSSPDIGKLYTNMNTELEKLNEWFKANRLCLNVKKTKYILFRPSIAYPKIINEHIYLNGLKVDQISHNNNDKYFKFLGIHIDETLSWKYHIDKICSKISRSNYILRKINKFLPKSSMRTLYSSLVQSYINYGLLVWGSSRSIGKVYKLQKKAIRIINDKHCYYHTEPLFKSCKILKIQDQYTYNVLTFMHQLKYNTLPRSFETIKYFETINKPMTRQHQLAHYAKPRTTYTSLLPLHKYPRIWNGLDTVLHEVISENCFRKRLKNLLIKKYKIHVTCVNTRCKQCFPL
jgi:hypothetical protein